MQVEIKKADLPRDLELLMELDRRIFSPSDLFTRRDWQTFDCYFLVVDGTTVGAAALQSGITISDTGGMVSSPGCMHIASTGILPEYQKKGLGQIFKSWEIAYARRYGFERVTTNARAGNQGSIGLNQKFGFRTTGRVPDFYSGPVEEAVVLELIL